MDDEDYLRWLVDRADRLRATVASSAAMLVTANAIVLSGIGFVTQEVWGEVRGASPTPWFLLAQLPVIGSAWIACFAALVRALGAVGAANGFPLSEFPSRHQKPTLVDMEVPKGPVNREASLRRQLAAAMEYLSLAQTNLHHGGFNLLLGPMLIGFSFLVRGFLQD